jgi:hypothetical protein
MLHRAGILTARALAGQGEIGRLLAGKLPASATQAKILTMSEAATANSTSNPTGATSAKAKTRRKWPRWLVWTGWSLLGVLAAVSLGTFLTLWFGGVHGVEINPHTFARRSYSFYEIPLLRWQVRGIRREDVASTSVDFLAQQKYVAPTKGAPNVWHIVAGTRGVSAPVIGDADILVRYLEAQDAEDYHVYVKWSEKNPNLAKLFWPAVSRLAQEEEYLFIPDLFELAESATDPVAFQTALNKKVAERLFELGQHLQEAEEHGEAKKLLEEASQLDTTNPLIRRAVEKSAALAPKETAPQQKPPPTTAKTAKP